MSPLLATRFPWRAGWPVFLGLVAVIEVLARGTGAGMIGLATLFCLVGLATTLPLVLPAPTLAATVVFGAGVGSLAVLHTVTVAGCAAQLVAAYRVGRWGQPVVAVLAVVPYLLIVVAASRHAEVAVLGVLLAGGVPAVALAATARRLQREDLATQAARQAITGTLLEHTARGERARIARELHDVVAHHISMIAVQAETARLTTPGMPPLGAQRLSAIGNTARGALTEMRRLLGVLREDAPPEVGDRAPQPNLAQLNDLLDVAREATGAGTRLILRGAPVVMDPGVELAAYRIVQEALTNARRHAPGAAVDVELHYTDVALRLLVRDNGPGPGPDRTPDRTPPAPGHGLAGMRERAAAVGGTLRTGPAGMGGFLVEARLPTRGEDTP